MVNERRSTWELTHDILYAIKYPSRKKLTFTGIQIDSLMAYDRFRVVFARMEKYKLVKKEPKIKITAKGIRCFKKAKKIKSSVEELNKLYFR